MAGHAYEVHMPKPSTPQQPSRVEVREAVVQLDRDQSVRPSVTPPMVMVVTLDTGGKGITPPEDGDAGYDLYADEDVFIPEGATRVIRTGVRVQLPPRHFGHVLDRSSLAANKNLHVIAGVIDPGYRGEIMVVMNNLGRGSQRVRPGDKIAQMVVVPYSTPQIRLEDALAPTSRGEKGFGSTGR